MAEGCLLSEPITQNEQQRVVLRVGAKDVVVDSAPAAPRKEWFGLPLMWERHVELSQPHSGLMTLGPKKTYFLALLFFLLFAVAGIVLLLSDWEARGVGLFFLLPLPAVISVYCIMPRWTFCRETSRLICRRIWTRRELSLTQIIAVQVCFGGRYYLRGISDSDPDTPYDTYQLNLVLDDGSRLNLTHHAELEWTRRTGQQLAGFLGIPLLEQSLRGK